MPRRRVVEYHDADGREFVQLRRPAVRVVEVVDDVWWSRRLLSGEPGPREPKGEFQFQFDEVAGRVIRRRLGFNAPFHGTVKITYLEETGP